MFRNSPISKATTTSDVRAVSVSSVLWEVSSMSSTAAQRIPTSLIGKSRTKVSNLL